MEVSRRIPTAGNGPEGWWERPRWGGRRWGWGASGWGGRQGAVVWGVGGGCGGSRLAGLGGPPKTGTERGLGSRGGGRRGERSSPGGENGGGGRRQGRTSLQHQPQREAVVRGGLAELAVAKAQVAGAAELLHGVWEFGGHSRGPHTKWRPPPFPPSLTDQSPGIKPRRRGLDRTATLAGRGRHAAGPGVGPACLGGPWCLVLCARRMPALELTSPVAPSGATQASLSC